MNRILKTLAASFCLSAALTASIAMAQQGQISAGIAAFTHPQTVAQDLARLDMALNNTETLSGRFVQNGSDGSYAQGALHLQRPGKIRFDYDDPNPMLIVSDGVTIMQSDTALGTSDRIPLSSTPLDFFLKQTVSLARDTDVLALQKLPASTQVTVRDGTGKAAGEMTLVFNEPNLALMEWRVKDEFGVETRVALSNLTYNETLDPRLFVLGNDSRSGATGGPRRRRD